MVESGLTWPEAFKRCKAYGARLLEVKNADENVAMHEWAVSINCLFFLTFVKVARSRGLVVKAEDSCPRGCGFESPQRRPYFM